MYLHFPTQKISTRYVLIRGVAGNPVSRLTGFRIESKQDKSRTEAKLLNWLSIRKTAIELQSHPERVWFRKHLNRYLDLLCSDCQFQVTKTIRYNTAASEATVQARERIERGTEIKYLSGICVGLTETEESDLRTAGKDFSVVQSTRLGVHSLLLGPVRFVNHDCNANSTLTILDTDILGVTAKRTINKGEEITLFYSPDYFEDGNRQCLCSTCERDMRNGWSGLGKHTPQK